MQQQISVVTLGVSDLAASRRFYVDGFGWTPVFESPEIIFYQMNGLVLGTWMRDQLDDDMQRTSGGFAHSALAHNVGSEADVTRTIDRLAAAGGRVMRPADAPPHGGFRGYIADPDDHAWEIAFNPAWKISPKGYITFGV